MIDKMNSIHRRKLLKEVANKERNMESDVLAIIALDEIAEMDAKIVELTNDANLKRANMVANIIKER